MSTYSITAQNELLAAWRPKSAPTARQRDFVVEARAYAAKHDCTLRAAMSALAKEDPLGHERYVDSLRDGAQTRKRR